MSEQVEPVTINVDSVTLPLDPSTRSAAFRWLAEQHLPAAYRLAYAILRDPAAAEDATHDAFVQAWAHWGELRDTARFEQWFTRILVNTCRQKLRQAARFGVRDISDALRNSDDAIGRADERALVRTGLSELSLDHRVVLVLRYYRDLSPTEIATRLGIRVGTVHSRLHYALRHLAAVLGRSLDGDQQ